MKTRQSSILLLATLLSTATFSSLFAADQRPKPVIQTAPDYPYEMKKNDFEGAVLVKLDISAQGEVTKATVISSTRKVFESPTLVAIKKWKFTPGTKDGLAVNTQVNELVTFTVMSDKPETSTASLVAKLQPRGSEIIVASNR